MLNRRSFLAGLAAPAPAPTNPNVVLILADDMGFDLGCYRGEIPTPNLDRLAGQGVRFGQGYVASPICSPSRAGITTGQQPSRHLIFSYIHTRQRQRELGMRDWLDPQAPLIARAFKNANYATAHFGKWHLGGGRDVGEAPLPTEYGFDESYTSFEGLGDRVLPPGALSDQNAKLGRGQIARAPQAELSEIYVNRALDFVRRNTNRPFYLQLWTNDVHDPFAPKPELMKKYERFSANKYVQQYYAMLDEMDRQVGRLVDGIDAAGLAERTLFVFLSDNGPTAWPRYYKEGFPPPGRTDGLRGRKWSLYEGGIRVPFFARWKGRIPAGRLDNDTILSSLDLFPTLTRLAGVKAPAVDFDGEDMSAALLGKPQRRTKDLFWEYGRDATYIYPGDPRDRSPNLALRSGDWKALLNDDGSNLELYDLGRSRDESQNLAAKEPRRAKQMADRLLAWRKSLPKL
ncbi:MAG: sulfatase-like hydrolase/transferase [Bryobacter sp.]|nr:sulfatase-like hydrolase/transferase [Bryobacter sp.]